MATASTEMPLLLDLGPSLFPMSELCAPLGSAFKTEYTYDIHMLHCIISERFCAVLKAETMAILLIILTFYPSG